MTRLPDTFPDIDLGATSLELTDGILAEPIGGGFNSQAWRIGSQVLKVTKGSVSHIDADLLRLTMLGEHLTLEESLGDYMPPTEYFVAVENSDEERAHVVTVQPFVEGKGLIDFISNPDSSVDNLQEFLERCRQVYHKNKLMPDIGNIETAFNVFRNSNVLVEGEDDQPVLVDTTFGKIQRSKALGPIWTRAIYTGSLVASARLKLERPRSAQVSVT